MGNERLTTNQNQRHQVCSPRQRGVGLRVGSGHEGGGACLTSGATPTSDDEHSKFFISLSLHSHLIKKAWLIYMEMFDLNCTPNRTKLGSSVNVKCCFPFPRNLLSQLSGRLLGGSCSNDERDYGF